MNKSEKVKKNFPYTVLGVIDRKGCVQGIILGKNKLKEREII